MSKALRNLPDDSQLMPLAEPGRSLSREELKAVLEQIPLLVVADGEQDIRRVILRQLRRTSSQPLDLVTSDVSKSFAELLKTEVLPSFPIVCEESQQTREALQNILIHNFDRGVLVFGDIKGNRSGLDLFRDYANVMPQGIARVLYSASPPANLEMHLKDGTIDAGMQKGTHDFIGVVARTYLRKRFGNPPKSDRSLFRRTRNPLF